MIRSRTSGLPGNISARSHTRRRFSSCGVHSANMKMALEVMEAWGFTYKAQAVWIKDRTGLGSGVPLHEVLLYGTRGNMPGPQINRPRCSKTTWAS